MLHTARDFLDLDWAAVHRQVEEGFISRQTLPGTDLAIYNYTAKAQWEWHWTPETMACRGLIADSGGVVVARPFPKFFSAEQLTGVSLPNEPFEVHEKVDGSLGILYWDAGTPRIASRGSFISEQAVVGSRILGEYDAAIFRPEVTYLFEIIYPANKIVVDYGGREALVLLAAFETSTGKELPLTGIDFPVVARRYDFRDMATVLSWAEPNAEGFVIRFASGVRVKVKTEEYKRLHRLVTGVNAKVIWELLATGHGTEEVLERVPDEFYQWVKDIEAGLRAQYAAIEDRCRADFRVLDTRKDSALYYRTCPYPSILFSMLDGKAYSDTIWKLIKPRGDKPFRVDEV